MKTWPNPQIVIAAIAWTLLASCGGGGGGDSPSPPPPPPATQAYTNPTVYSSDPNASLANAPEITATTQHQLVLAGSTLAYTATAGHLNALALGTGAARASFFFVAYTLDGAAPATRPVTFFYNGGPGSASVWLHLGSFGPKRLDTRMPTTAPASAPYQLVDNLETLLDVSDLVFVDAVSAGFSQAIAPNVNRTFYGVQADAEVFRDFVMRYLIANNRQSSPKFLFGESYGGPRTAVLAELLETAGVRLEGVVLQSPAMNYANNCAVLATQLSCANYLPSFGATAAWFNRASPNPAAAEVPAFMATMRGFAIDEFEPARQSWSASGVPPPAPLLDRLVATTGLARTAWQAQLNRGPSYYRLNLTPGTIHGRYDTRVTLPNNSPPGQEIDPSSAVISPSFQVRINEYLAGPLGYTNPSTYMLISNAIQSWNFAHEGRSVPDTIPDLAAAIALNPRLKVLAVNGYHDIATPFFATEQDLARLAPNPNVEVRNYFGGHMTYLDDASRRAMKADLAAWYRAALAD